MDDQKQNSSMFDNDLWKAANPADLGLLDMFPDAEQRAPENDTENESNAVWTHRWLHKFLAQKQAPRYPGYDSDEESDATVFEQAMDEDVNDIIREDILAMVVWQGAEQRDPENGFGPTKDVLREQLETFTNKLDEHRAEVLETVIAKLDQHKADTLQVVIGMLDQFKGETLKVTLAMHEDVRAAVRREKAERKQAEEKEAERKESAKVLDDATKRALQQHRELLGREEPVLMELELVDYMALMRFTPMAVELLYSTSGSTSLTPADVVNAIKMVHPGLTVVDKITKWVDVEDAFERLAKCTSTKPKDRLFRLLSLAEQGAPTIPKLQDHQKKRPAEEEAEGSTSAKKKR
jgi:hypothetical protein